MSKSIVQNTKYLNALASIIKNEESKHVAQEIIKLYKNRNISHITTVEKYIKKLTSKNKISRESGIKIYNENKENWENITLRILKLLKEHLK